MTLPMSMSDGPSRMPGWAEVCALALHAESAGLLVAGGGPRMLRLAARHAQAWNTAWHGAPDDRLRAQLAAMARALADEGREAGSLRSRWACP